MPQWNLDELPPALRDRVLQQMQAEQPAAPAPAAEEPRKANPAERRREVADIQRPFAQWLDLRGIPYVNPRSDKASGIREGWPDFTVLWKGSVLCIECKAPGQKLREEQERVRVEISATGTQFFVAYSAVECISLVKQHLLHEN